MILDEFNSYEIMVKEPKICSEKELSDFYEKVAKGGKVMLQGLKIRIKNCELLAFCYFKNELIGISSIKKPSIDYIENVITKSKIDRKSSELRFEIGYSFTEFNFRRRGISQNLKDELLEKMKFREGIIFSTTAIKSSQNFLEQQGFVKYGKPFDGNNDKDIIYYEKV